ncbi:MAG: 23S rRNA (pseudouridine(1915)-N(3))-methyltransferase RlmH [Bacteroidales bacterium]|jgi:23S rRNA (pseudouridine1915-N3)-methyltransferase
MKTALLQMGKTTEGYVSEGLEIYSSRISKYTGFEIITIADIKNTRNMPSGEQKIKEGRKIVEALGKNDYIILLDERGKELDTSEFARWIEKKLADSGKRLVFIIGGAWGFSEELYSRADFSLSLSKMTFPHQMVRLLFAEQLYRAFTIIKGDPYHHA